MGLFKKEKTETKKDIKLVVRKCPECKSQLEVGFKQGKCKACGSFIDYYEVVCQTYIYIVVHSLFCGMQ